jgi:NADPH:quinone reductase-like Zn-dependent oxidoreductase
VTYRSLYDYKHALSSNGRYVMLGGGSYDRVFQVLYLGPWISLTERLSGRKPGKKMGLLMHKPNKEDLNTLAKLFVEGKVTPVVDKCYIVEEVIEAFKYYEGDMAKGKVIITI